MRLRFHLGEWHLKPTKKFIYEYPNALHPMIYQEYVKLDTYSFLFVTFIKG